MALVRFQTPLGDLSEPSKELRQVFFSNLLKTSRKFELIQSKVKSIYLATQSYNCLGQSESYKSHITETDDGFLNANMFNLKDSICLCIRFCRALQSNNS
jgi:hypothetical protein